MTIAQLIEKLKQLPQDEEIDRLTTDEETDHVWLNERTEIRIKKNHDLEFFTRKNNEQATV